MTSSDLLLSSYDYDLPSSHIAQLPASPAHNANLLIATPDASHDSYNFHYTTFFDLPNHLSQEYLLFFNETKVFKARIPLQNIKIIRASGKELILEQGEVFVYQLLSENTFECLVSDSKNFKPGSKVQISDTIFLESQEFTENGIKFQIHWEQLLSFLEKYAQMPLPPYIKYEKEKEQWYQTFFAQKIGSAAAPTASLHFTPELIQKLKEKKAWMQFLCLHVGLWTFKPVSEEVISNQKLHFEPLILPADIRKKLAEAKQQEKIFLPIGTTMIRFLESLPYIWRFLKAKNLTPSLDPETQKWRDHLTKDIDPKLVEEFIPDQEPLPSENIHWVSQMIIQTRLFIRPGIPFYLTDELITNFHLPKSSLMMLISAFMGRKNLLNTYQEAIEKWYYFYSFGDGMRVRRS